MAFNPFFFSGENSLKKFHDFFNLNESADPNKDTCGILTVEGRTHPVDVFYTVRWATSTSRERVPRCTALTAVCVCVCVPVVFSPVPDYVKATVETVMKIHETEEDGDVLAFLTGQVRANTTQHNTRERFTASLLMGNTRPVFLN